MERAQFWAVAAFMEGTCVPPGSHGKLVGVHLRFAFEPRDAIGVEREALWQNLQRTAAIEVCVFAR